MADIASSSWHEDDNANSEAAPLGSPENMFPSGVNNVLRAHQGAIKRMWKRNSVMVTTGLGSTYMVTHAVPPTAYADGETELIEFHGPNAFAATLNVGGLSDRPLFYYSAGAWRFLPPFLLGANQITRIAYESASGAYRLIDLPDRTGEIVLFAGDTAPAGTLLCFGQALNRNEYSGLFAALGTAHGVGDGFSSFNLPDLRGRVAAGCGNMGGPESDRLSSYVSSTLGAAGGDQDGSYSLSGGTFAGGGTAFTNGLGTTFETASAGVVSGGSGPFALHHIHTIVGDTSVDVSGSLSGSTDAGSNVQPTMSLNYIIRI